MNTNRSRVLVILALCPVTFLVLFLFCFDLQSLNAFTDPSHFNQLCT